MHKVWYIHGANATKASFNYIHGSLPKHVGEFIEYSTDEPLYNTIVDLADRLRDETVPVHIIAHSLGGIIAVALAQRVPEKVTSVITMSTPFSGSGAATKALWTMPWDPFLMNASSLNPIIYTVKNTKISVPVHSFVTTNGGNSLMKESNDGVVTVASQMSLGTGVIHKVPLNHFEVLISPEVVGKITSIVETTEKSS